MPDIVASIEFFDKLIMLVRTLFHFAISAVKKAWYVFTLHMKPLSRLKSEQVNFLAEFKSVSIFMGVTEPSRSPSQS